VYASIEHDSRVGVGPPHLRRVKSVVLLGAKSMTRSQTGRVWRLTVDVRTAVCGAAPRRKAS